MAGLLTVVGDMPGSLHGGRGGCGGKMPFGDTGRRGVGDAPYSPESPKLVELVGPLVSGMKLVEPKLGGGAEGMGVDGSVTCGEIPMLAQLEQLAEASVEAVACRVLDQEHLVKEI